MKERQGTTAEVKEALPRGITIKSTLFGFLSLLLIILLDDYNCFYLSQTPLNAGFLPVGPIFLILSIALVWNPIWHRLAKRMVLQKREMIFSLLIVLAGCWTGGAGLAQFNAYSHIVPWVKYENDVLQQKYESLDYVPEYFWPAGGLGKLKEENNVAEQKRVYDAFFTGYEMQASDGVPWDAWISPLAHWIPFFICLAACFLGLSILVHQQWSKHEQIPYPLAKIASTFYDKEPDRALPNLFYMRSFWIAFAIVACFHGIRLLHVWWPSSFPNIEKGTGFKFLYDIFPVLSKSGHFFVTQFHFSFATMAICYFLPREVGLTIGLSSILLALVSAQVYLMTGDKLDGTEISNGSAGAYIAFAFVILYTGRHFYKSVTLKAITFAEPEEHEVNSVWGARLLLISFFALIVILCTSFELDFFIALTYALLILLAFLVFTRVICETGIPFLQLTWSPSLFITKLFGASTIGAAPIVIMAFIRTVAFMDAKNAMMPFVANGLKMADDQRMKLKRICKFLLVLIVIAIVVALLSRLHQHYTYGVNVMNDLYAKDWAPQGFLNESTDQLITLDDIGQRHSPDQSQPLGFFERLGLINPDGGALTYAFLGAAGVLLFFFLRIRYTGFMLHPVLFIIWGNYHVAIATYPILIGWFIRELILRYGGDSLYQSAKPFFIGLILGELFLVLLSTLCGINYNIFTGDLPPV